MGPSTGTPNFNQAPRPAGGGAEVGGNNLPQYNVDPATTLNSSPENFNQAPLQAEQLANAERLAQPSQVVPAAPTQPVAITPSAQPVATQPTKTVDAEQLEREWVNKAQQAIAKDQDDPYELAHRIAMLMSGYLRERYGKIIGKSGPNG